MLSPRDIETKEFSRSKVGGYKPEEVDSFLDEILINYNSLLEEREASNKKLAALNEKIEKYRDEQDQWKNTILNTQKSYDEVIKNAKKKADKLVFDAQEYSKKLIEAAKAETDHQQEVKKQLSTEVDEFKTKLLSIYESHVKLISSIPVIKKENIIFQSDTLEMLKMAAQETVSDQYKKESPLPNTNVNVITDSIGSKVVDVDFSRIVKNEEPKYIEKNKDELHEKIDNATSENNYDDMVYDLRNKDENKEADVKTTYNFQTRNKKVTNERDISKTTHLVLNEDDEKESKIRRLFEEDKDKKNAKTKKLFGGKTNKKSLKLFGKASDDDEESDEDEDYYDDDDE